MPPRQGPATLNDTPLPLQILSAEGKIIAVNDSWELLTGYSEAEVEGLPYSELIPPDRMSDFRRNMDALVKEGHLEAAPCHVQCKSGAEREVLLFAQMNTAEGTTLTRCILLDTTTLRRAERSLAESNARFRSIFELAPSPMVVHDGVSVVLVNKAAARFLGYDDPEALVGKGIAALVHPDSAPAVAERVKRMLAQDWTAPMAEETYLRADGTPIRAETIASPVTVSGRRLIHVLALDVSERLKAQAALAESEARFRSLFEASADAVVVHDGVNVLFANKTACDHFRLPPEVDASGLEVARFIHPDSRSLVMGRIAALLAGQPPHSPIEIKLTRMDDTTWETEAVSSMITLDGQNVIQSTFRDLTERKRTERELALYRDELERLVEERTRSLSQARADMAAVTAIVGRTIEMRDPYTAGHQLRVAQLSVAIARTMGMEETRIIALQVAAQMHDVGKVLVPAEILSKPTALNEIEFNLVKSHAWAGYDIVSSANLHDPIAEIVYQHHERMDGSGYPRGLAAERLLPESRVLMVADVFEAMASHRPYRPSLGVAAALKELHAGRGTRYDSDVVDACISVLDNGFEFLEA